MPNELISMSCFHLSKASITPKEFWDGAIHGKEIWRDNLRRFWLLKNKPEWRSDQSYHVKDCTKLQCTQYNVGYIKYKRLVEEGKIVMMKNGFRHCSKNCDAMIG